MNEAHQRFHDWLTAGAEGEPPRDVAVHASVCADCRQSMDALDLLGVVDPGLAKIPATPTGAERGRIASAGRLGGAAGVLFSAVILGVGVSQLIGVSRASDPVAQASRTPDQNVLAGTATPQPTPEANATPTATQETLTPIGTPAPTQQPPVATPVPYRTATPTPIPPPVPTPVPTAIPTPVATDSATPVPTASATPVPTATPSPDADADGVSDAVEVQYGSDPANASSTPENLQYNPSTCIDTVDNDLDGSADASDSGCL